MRKIMAAALALALALALLSGCAPAERAPASLHDSVNSEGGYVFEGMKLWGLSREKVLAKVGLSQDDVEPILIYREDVYRQKDARTFDEIEGEWEVYFIFEDDVMAAGRYILVCETEEELTAVCDKLANILNEWPVFPRHVGDERFPQTGANDEAEGLRAVADGSSMIGVWRIQADGTLLAVSRSPFAEFAIAITVYSKEPGPR